MNKASRWQVGDLVSYRGLNSRIARVDADPALGGVHYLLAPPRSLYLWEDKLSEPVVQSIEALTDVIFMLEKRVEQLSDYVNRQTCGAFLAGAPPIDRDYFAAHKNGLPEQLTYSPEHSSPPTLPASALHFPDAQK